MCARAVESRRPLSLLPAASGLTRAEQTQSQLTPQSRGGRSRLGSRTKDEAAFHFGLQLCSRDPDLSDPIFRAVDPDHIRIRGLAAPARIRHGEPILAVTRGATVDDEYVTLLREVSRADADERDSAREQTRLQDVGVLRLIRRPQR